jgi:hypothetical protein
MIARNIDHAGAVTRFSQQFLDNVIMFLRPVEAFFQLPAINDVADQIQGFAARIFQKMQQLFGTGPWRSEMRVRDPFLSSSSKRTPSRLHCDDVDTCLL